MSISLPLTLNAALRPLALSTVLFLGGCLLPPAAMVASTALDGLSLATSGKSVTSHALSFVTQRDCSIMRGLSSGDLGAVCRLADAATLARAPDAPIRDRASRSTPPSAPKPVLVAEAPLPAPRAPEPPRPIVLAALDEAPVTNVITTPQPAPADEKTDAAREPAVFLVIGSFRLADRAQVLVQKFAALSPSIAIGIVEGKVWFRVVVGPLDGEAIDAMRDAIAARGIADAWAIRLCPGELTAPPCRSPGAPARRGPPARGIAVALAAPAVAD